MKLRRILVFIFVLCLAVCVMAVSASAAEIVASGECGELRCECCGLIGDVDHEDAGIVRDDVFWKLDSDGVFTVYGEGKMWTEGEAEWLQYRKQIKTVIVEDGITKISPSAFAACTNLKKVQIGASVEEIDYDAFINCESLTEVDILGDLTSIGSCAFQYCYKLSKINLPDSLECIGGFAFYQCESLTNLFIPASMTSIGDGESEYNIFTGCVGLKTVTIPTSVKYIAPETFLACENIETVYYFGGSQKLWNKIDIQEGNQHIQNPTKVYKYTAPSVSTPPVTVYAKQGESAKVTSSAKGTGKLTCTWYYKKDGETKYVESSVKGSTYSVKMNSKSKDRRVYCVVKDIWGNTARSKTVVLRVAATITEQPKSVNVKQGDTAKVSVKAIGDGLTYAWYVAPAGEDEFVKSSSFTGSTYSMEMSENRDGRQVYCVVKDKYGKTAKSNTVTLNMHELPKITTQPKTTYTKNGATASVSVKATGVGLKYAWYVKSEGSTAFKKSSVTKSTYSVKMTSGVKDGQIYCVVTDALGSKVKTKTVYLRMAASIGSQPKNASAKSGEKAKTTVKALGDGLKYTWYIKNPGDSKFTKSSVTTASYSVTMSKTTDGRQAYCVVTDKYGKKVTSNTVMFGIAARVTAQPKTVYVKNGASAKVIVKATGHELSYTWYVKNKGETKYTKSSVTKSSYSVTMSSKVKDRLVYCVVKDKFGNTVKTNTVSLRMTASITKQPTSVIAAKGKTAKTTVKALGDGLTYTWYMKDPGASKFTKSSVKSAAYSAKMSSKNDGRQVYCVVKDKYGNTVKTKTVKLFME